MTGRPEKLRRRREDEQSRPPGRAMVVLVLLAVALAFAGGVGVKAILTNQDTALDAEKLAKRIQRSEIEGRAEATVRRDETCRLFERLELAAVTSVVRTYAYLDNLPASERGTNLTQEIVRGLPDKYKEAKNTRAPAYCDEPGAKAEALWRRTRGKQGTKPIGLAEPGLELPAERTFRHLLQP